MALLGNDGFPVPVKKDRNKYTCVCPICIGANASLSTTKTGSWIVRCPACSIILYLNDITSINLFRGLQKFLNEDPDHQVRHTAGIVSYAPDEGT